MWRPVPENVGWYIFMQKRPSIAICNIYFAKFKRNRPLKMVIQRLLESVVPLPHLFLLILSGGTEG